MATEQTRHTTPLPIVVLGTSWCEDTALVRSRLQALGLPFVEHDVENDPVAMARIRQLNGGAQVTPTVILGDAQRVMAEPSLEEVSEALVHGGWNVRPPTATQYRAPRTEQPVPRLSPTADVLGHDEMDTLRGRRQVALFLAHDVKCLACLGYARQLGRHGRGFAAANAVAIVAVRSTLEAVREWRESIDDSVVLVADPDGTWTRAVSEHVGLGPDGVALLLLDRWHAARAGSVATEAGGLIDPPEAVRWLEFLELECPECAGEIAWSPELG